WHKNCVAIGLSAGFVEPLESTSISLIETAVGTLLSFFPDRDFRPGLADEFNRIMLGRYESVRDFIIMHYKLTGRTDTEFWRHCASMAVPDSVMHQVEVFRQSGRVVVLDRDGFSEPSFVPILMGLGVAPESYDPAVDMIEIEHLHKHFVRVRQAIASTAHAMPDHGEFIAANLRADPIPGLAV
ncbi:MAG: tryptophan 7-halogenase, partial [Gammaproteobacteria bacterium]